MSIIDHLAIYKQASPKTQFALSHNGYPVNIKKGQYLFHIRDQVNTVYLIVSGYVVLNRESDEHGVRSIFLLGAGEFINEIILDGLGASISCLALSDLTVITYSKTTLLEMMKNDFQFNKYVIFSISLKVRKLYHMLESSSKITKLDHQTASRIWKFTRDFGIQKDGYLLLPFELRITLLASFMGSNRETISRIIKKMTVEGILSIDKGVCKIYDVDALKKYGKDTLSD